MRGLEEPRALLTRRGARAVAALMIWTAVFGAAPARAIDGRIVQAGFPTSATLDAIEDETAGKSKYREGTWLPILVELFTEESGPIFTGSLRIAQRDRDGDLAMTEQHVSFRGQRRFWLFPVAAPQRGDEPFAVQVLDADGNAVRLRHARTGAAIEKLVPPEPPLKLDTESLLVLDISERPLLLLYRIPSRGGPGSASGERKFNRSPAIARWSAKDLPPHWCGLSMADVIVWDSPDPDVMADPHQMPALTEWVYRGGVLIVGVGSTWEKVRKSALEPLLPGPLNGARDVKSLPEMAEFLGRSAEDTSGSLAKPLTICPLNRAELRPGTRVLYPTARTAGRVMVCTRTVGRGQVVYVGARLRDLYEQGRDMDELAVRLLGLRPEPERDEGQQVRGVWGDYELFRHLAAAVGFETSASLFFLFAFVFVVGYILVSSLGTWQWLKARGSLKHSWSAFAVAAVLASALSLGAVRAIRGIGRDVEELSVVDMHAVEHQGQTQPDAQAISLFGLKTGSHERLDVLLPQDWTSIDEAADTPCWLRVLPPEPGLATDFFVAPDQYRIIPTRARLENVPFRATLKLFEGSWRGQIRGRIVASLPCVKRASGYYELTADAWIRNELGVDLVDCLLLHAESDPDAKNPPRWADQIKAIRLSGAPRRGFADQSTLTGLDVQAYGTDPDLRARRSFSPRLSTLQREWAVRFGIQSERSFREEEKRIKVTTDLSEAALLLATTFEEFRPAADAGGWRTRGLARTYLTGMDVSRLLTREAALFIGFSETPGPARLCCRPSGTNRRYRSLTPGRALTMYRVLIPLKTTE